MPASEAKQQQYISVAGMLSELAQAGEAGMATGELSRKFAYRDSYGGELQRLLAEANTLLATQARMGNITRSATMEPSAYYHNTPNRRWFITVAGREYLAAGGRMEIARRARAEASRAREEKRLRREQAREEGTALLGAAAGSMILRDAVICQLRAQGDLTLEDIGSLTGLTRERVRQIARDGGVT